MPQSLVLALLQGLQKSRYKSRCANLTSMFRSAQIPNRLILQAISWVPYTVACFPLCYPAQPPPLLLSLRVMPMLNL
jgi:hypothetical protein